ncbi:MAG: hypothetical protein KAH93_00465, partial [Candidatus Aenigmarchaeota archaeon]|nr:hypothetical protein [Candidatus Aenigmarchaeota archaeon]
VGISCEPLFKGLTYFVNYTETVNQTPQKIWTYWEDKGSIGCTNRLRIDIYNSSIDKLKKTPEGFIDPLNTSNQNKLQYTAWSKEVLFSPGENDYLVTYWYPFNISGKFTGQFRLYSCNEIYEKPPFAFEVLKWQQFPEPADSEKMFEKIAIKNNDENNIEITLKSRQDLNNLLILPAKYPRGWIFEYAKIDQLKKGREIKIPMSYIPGIWAPTNITLHFVTEDGTYYFEKEFTIEKQQSDNRILFATITTIFFILTIFFVKHRTH